jgi:hypothetical protein
MMTLMLVALAAAAASSAEPQSQGGPPGIVLPPPKAALPAPPADGSGSYRLTFDGLLPGGYSGSQPSCDSPLVAYLDVRGGKVVSAIGHGLIKFDEPYVPVDAAGLTVTGGRLRGTLSVTLPGLRVWTWHYKVGKEYGEGKLPLDPPSRGTLTVSLDLPADAARGEGTYTCTMAAAAAEKKRSQRADWQGTVRMVRGPAPSVGQTMRVHLYLPFALGPTYGFPQVAVLAELSGGTGARMVATWAIDDKSSHFNQFPVTGTLALADGRLTGRVELRPRPPGHIIPAQDLEPVTLEIAGTLAGRWIGGTAAATGAGKSWHSVCLGRWRSEGWPIPLEMPEATWTWQHDLPADPALAAEAEQEAREAVLEGRPGERGFWTWRFMMAHGGQTASIRPPNFDLREVPGAVSYRFTAIKEEETKERNAKGVSATLDKPWKPLAGLWTQLQVGVPYQVSFEALDAQGQVLSTSLKMGIEDRASAKPVEQDLTSLRVLRKPAFCGPYATAPRDPLATALLAARWSSEVPNYPLASSMLVSQTCVVGGEAYFSYMIASKLYDALVRRALAPTGEERAYAEETLDVLTDALRLNQMATRADKKTGAWEGLFYVYKACIPLARMGGEAALDTLVATGDPRGQEMALKLGAGLAANQTAGGSWVVVGVGCSGYKQGWQDWGAAEMLYVLGRIRRDCRTERFVEAETRAYRHVMDRQVKAMFWPCADVHSGSWGYPICPHAQAAMYFIRYLLELAPAERRDVALAEQLALWCEDIDVDWTRAEGPQQGTILPRLSRGDRAVCNPIYNGSLFALACLQLHRATGKRLWLAKADALIAACLQAHDPASGLFNMDLEPKYSGGDKHFAYGGYLGNLCEYAVLRADIQPPFKVAEGKRG